ncbi:Lysophosphatidic acid acyltransferase LPAAT, partial [Pseudoloma neurophilia]
SIKRYWLSLTISIFQFFFPVPIYVSYEKEIKQKNRTIIISNHLTNWDWLIILIILKELKMYDHLCVIMKESLKKIPIFGYGMKCFGYIFLKRNWIEDSSTIHSGIDDLKKKKNYQILIYPEGTFLEEESYKKSIKFAENNNIIVNGEKFRPKHSLIPRKKGIDEIKDALFDNLEGIIDVTMFITPYKRYLTDQYSFFNILFKKVPPPHFYFIIDEVKDTRSSDWLFETFYKKEKLLKELVDLHKPIEQITTLAEFATFINNLLSKKNQVFQKRIKTGWFMLYLIVFLIICGTFINYCRFR